jgi:hypothetical protein
MKHLSRLSLFLRAAVVAFTVLFFAAQPAQAAECVFPQAVSSGCTCNYTVILGVCMSPVNQTSGGLTNPAIRADLGGSPTAAASGVTFATYFVYLWRVIIFVGGLIVIVFLIQGAIDWIGSGGEKGKVEKAREKITNSIVGMIILLGSFLLISFIGSAIGYDLLNPQLPTAGTQTIQPNTLKTP